MITFLTGGARSGKSAMAVQLAAQFHGDVVFLATAEGLDDEMRNRIDLHRAERPMRWQTIEEPVKLVEQLERIDQGACVIVDCLTMWVMNLIESDSPESSITAHAHTLAQVSCERPGRTIIISNEVGAGIVPVNELSRRFRDHLGQVNRIVADVAEHAFLVIAGRLIPLEHWEHPLLNPGGAR